MDVLKRYAKEGTMDGSRGWKVDVEKPIEKPSLPLPVIFSSGMYAEMPTRRRSKQKAYFFRRRVTESGTPVYGFYISDDTDH
jgi:hypothetical protein